MRNYYIVRIYIVYVRHMVYDKLHYYEFYYNIL